MFDKKIFSDILCNVIKCKGEKKKMDKKLIEKLPGSRWTKGAHDRLYISAEDLGLEISRYHTGNISSAKVVEWEALNGADMEEVNSFSGDISNSQARRLMSNAYLDLNTGEVKDATTWMEARIRYLTIKAKAELAAEEKAGAPKVTKKGKKLTVEQAVEEIAKAEKIADVEAVFEKSTVATLKSIARAVAYDLEEKVSSRAKRVELLELLGKHSSWFIGRGKILAERLTLAEKIKNFKKVKDLKEWLFEWRSAKATAGMHIAEKELDERLLMTCSKKVLVANLAFFSYAGVYSVKMKKTKIVEDYLHRKAEFLA